MAREALGAAQALAAAVSEEMDLSRAAPRWVGPGASRLQRASEQARVELGVAVRLLEMAFREIALLA